jgi:hypothetical protein
MAHFANKIVAIKALRTLIAFPEALRVQHNQETGKFELEVTGVNINLKDAKDFVESCMALGATEAQTPTHLFELIRVSAMNGQIDIAHQHIGFYRTFTAAVATRDNIMRPQMYNTVWETENDFIIREHAFRG